LLFRDQKEQQPQVHNNPVTPSYAFAPRNPDTKGQRFLFRKEGEGKEHGENGKIERERERDRGTPSQTHTVQP